MKRPLPFCGLAALWVFLLLLLGTGLLWLPAWKLAACTAAAGCVLLVWGLWQEQAHKNTRPHAEHGSARKGNLKKEASQLSAAANPDVHRRNEKDNIILSSHIVLDRDTRHTHLNDNVLVIGDSGSWKTMSFVKPNLLQLACSYVVLDPKGAVAEEIGHAFEMAQYEIRYLNLVDFSKSMGYNFFPYFQQPADITRFVHNLISNTSSEDKKGGDAFFENAEKMFISALCFYVRHVFASLPECTFNTVMDLFLLADVKEEDENYQCPLDALFDQLEEEVNRLKEEETPYTLWQFGAIAVSDYKSFKVSAGKTAKSILVSVGVRLHSFMIPEMRTLLEKDELHLERLGEPLVKSLEHPEDLSRDTDRKQWQAQGHSYEDLDPARLRKMVLFIITSDSDSTFDFMAAIVLQQIYQQLYRQADARKDHALPIHVSIINDEFANCGKQSDIDRKMATMRSRNISAAIIIQGISQLKALYKDNWESIFENCPTTLFLGGKGPATTELLSRLIGEETVVYKSKTFNHGRLGSHSTTDQILSRPLYRPSEIATLPHSHYLVHFRGHYIYEDEKYNLHTHPNICHTIHDPNRGEENRFDIYAWKQKMQALEEKRGLEIQPAKEEDGFADGMLQVQGLPMLVLSASSVQDVWDAWCAAHPIL